MDACCWGGGRDVKFDPSAQRAEGARAGSGAMAMITARAEDGTLHSSLPLVYLECLGLLHLLARVRPTCKTWPVV